MKYHNRKLYQHPVFSNFFADKYGTIYKFKNGDLKIKHQGVNRGYYVISITPTNCKQKLIRSHRFIYECITSKTLPVISYGSFNKDTIVVDHIDGDKSNNSFKNLQAISASDNSKKYNKDAGYDGLSQTPLHLISDPKMREIKRSMTRKYYKNWLLKKKI